MLSSFDSELTAELLWPSSAPHSDVLVVVPFYDTPSVFGEPTGRTRLQSRDPLINAHGLQLAAAGHAVLAVPWWFELQAAADPATADEPELAGRYGPTAAQHRTIRPMTALGRSIGDLMLTVSALHESGLADGMRLAAFGHSLGAKLAMHLAALDERIEFAVAHEPGLGFAHANWDAPWYLDGGVPDGRDQDELPGLVAPRPFLLAGGGASDGVHNRELARSAAGRWPGAGELDLLFHDSGHPLPRHLMAAISEWLRERSD